MGIFHGDAFSGRLGVVCKQSDRRRPQRGGAGRRWKNTGGDGGDLRGLLLRLGLGPAQVRGKGEAGLLGNFLFFYKGKF